MNRSIPIAKFVFHVNKPKSRTIAEVFRLGCQRLGYDTVITEDHAPKPGRIGVFYGVVPETYAAFQYYKAENQAVYLDNGWLSTSGVPSFRFSWNSAQPFLQDLEPDAKSLLNFELLPPIFPRPIPGSALLILQSKRYFDFMRVGYTRDIWQRVTTRLLHSKGFSVTTREKPTKKDPEAITFFEQLERAAIVVSLNSAATVKALTYGIPAYCTLDCTPSPLAPVRLPDPNLVGRPDDQLVKDMRLKMASYEFTKAQLHTGAAISKMLAVKPKLRRGYWYGTS